MGERLHEYDVDLTDYAIGNIIQFLSDRRFARWVAKHVTTPALIDYLRARSDPNVDAPQVRSLFGDNEMRVLAAAFEDGPPGGSWDWVPYRDLHRRYVETLREVREGLAKQVAEEWSRDCAGYARRLEVEGLALYEGIEIVREWVQQLRALQLAMGDEAFVPLGDRPKPQPPTPPPATETDAPNPDYPGLTPPQIRDVEKMREVVRSRTDGATAKPAALIKAANISNQRGRRALRWLAGRNEYNGFKR